jgi:hypothetical protein
MLGQTRPRGHSGISPPARRGAFAEPLEEAGRGGDRAARGARAAEVPGEGGEHVRAERRIESAPVIEAIGVRWLEIGPEPVFFREREHVVDHVQVLLREHRDGGDRDSAAPRELDRAQHAGVRAALSAHEIVRGLGPVDRHDEHVERPGEGVDMPLDEPPVRVQRREQPARFRVAEDAERVGPDQDLAAGEARARHARGPELVDRAAELGLGHLGAGRRGDVAVIALEVAAVRQDERDGIGKPAARDARGAEAEGALEHRQRLACAGSDCHEKSPTAKSKAPLAAATRL